MKTMATVLSTILTRRRWRYTIAIIVALILATGVISLRLNTDQAVPLPDAQFSLSAEVEASCTVVLNGNQWQQEDDDQATEDLTLVITLPDGTPLVGVCITFTLDNGPGQSQDVVGVCTTDEEGRCTIQAPAGIINVHFGNTKIGGIPVNNATDTIDALTDAAVGGVAYFFPAEQPAEENIVASQSDDGGSISMEHGKMGEDGSLQPVPPGPDIPDDVADDWNDWEIPEIGPIDDGGGFVFDPNGDFNTALPEGIVTVRFTPSVLRTSQAYDRVYCYYAVGDSGFARSPSNEGTFLPGGGTYFDLGAVLNGDARPGQVLQAETDTFDITLECWGFQGLSLQLVGASTDSTNRELWRGQSLAMNSGGFSLDYALAWYGATTQPNSPRLAEVGDVITESALPGAEGPIISADSVRFTDRLLAPSNVRLDDGLLLWDYSGRDDIGGFRIYRNGYLIGDAPPDVRGWSGDGLELMECGGPVEFTVTTYSGGAESVGSAPATVGGAACSANVTVTFDSLALGEGSDCDGPACGNASEMYGYLAVNDTTVNFGGGLTSPQTVGVQFGQAYTFTALLAPFGQGNQITVGLSSADALNIEVGLFDRDTNTTDDLLCVWQETLPARDAEGWQSQDGRVITRDATPGEAGCVITVQLSVE